MAGEAFSNKPWKKFMSILEDRAFCVGGEASTDSTVSASGGETLTLYNVTAAEDKCCPNIHGQEEIKDAMKAAGA